VSSRPGEITLTGLSPAYEVEGRIRPGSRWSVRVALLLRGTILLMLVANLGRIPVISTGDREAPILFNDIFVATLLLAGALAMLPPARPKIDRVALAAMAFAAIGASSAVLAMGRFGLSGMEVTVSLAYLLRWLLYFGLYVVVINCIRAADVDGIWRTFEWMLLLFCAFGILQSAFLPGFAQMVYPDSRVALDWDYQGRRLVSTVLEPNIAGILIVMGLLMQFARLSAGVKVETWKLVLMFAALVLTLSRSSLIALFAGTTLILATRGLSKKMLRVVFVVALLTLVALPQIIAFGMSYNKLGLDASAMARVVAWLSAVRVFVDNPVLGVGFNTYGFVQERYGIERVGASSYSTEGGLLFIAVMTGVVGLAIFIWMLSIVFRRCRQVWRNPSALPEWRAAGTGVAAATLAVCVHSVFVNSLLTTFVMQPLWILWGLTFVIAASLAGATEDRPPRPAVSRWSVGSGL
jgi:O-antigen ligase